MKNKSSIHSTRYDLNPKQIYLGIQTLCVAFGALVLVPILTGLDPSVALFTAGLGTLIFQITTKEKVPPIFLASSFAFIVPIIYGVKTWGISGTMCGLIAAGLVYVLLSFLVRIFGSGFIEKIFPPIVTGPVIMVIGLSLSPVAVNMAKGMSGDGAFQLVEHGPSVMISFVVCAVTAFLFVRAKGVFRLLAILFGIMAGYVLSLAYGIVDFSGVAKAPFLAWPNFTLPTWNLEAIFYMVPVAIAPAIEHLGDVMAISGVTKENYLEKPGLKNTWLGDGLATISAACVGGPPNTTYSEVTGSVMLTKAFNPGIMTWAAFAAIFFSCFGILGALLQSIPVPVMGGVLLVLFGAIIFVGIGILVREQIDYQNNKNLIVVGLILVSGIGGMSFSLGTFSISGIGLAGIIGVLANLLIPKDVGIE